MLGILIGAVMLGVIIAVMEDDFPEFLPLLGCVVIVSLASWGTSLAIGETQSIVVALLPLVAGAVAGGVAISAFLGMTVKRACIAASIYLGANLVFALLVMFAFGG